MLEKMKEIIADQLSVDADSITETTSFKDDLGADSLDLFELVMALEDEYSVEIPSEDLEKLTTVGAVMDYLKSKDKFYYQEQNLEKSLVSWAAKTLNLSLNMADLSVYYLDLYLLHFKERGFVPTDEWKTKEKAFHEAAKGLAEYMRYFFKGKSSDDNSESMSELMDLIERDYYTDREKVHHKQYEEKL